MYVYIFDTHISKYPRANRSGCPLESGASGFANLHLVSDASGRATLSALPGEPGPGACLESEAGREGAKESAVGRVLPGTDPRGCGAGHAPAAVAAAPRTRRRPRLLALFQASPSSPPRYKRRDRGAGASLRQLRAV